MFVVFALALSLAQLGNPVAAPASSAQETAASAKLSSSELAQLQSKAEAGDAGAQLALGRAYQDGNGVAPNDELAVKWYRKAAEQGNATAQNNLGIMYRAGSGVEKSKEEALKLYRKAARQDYANAMFNIGAAYYNGDGWQLMTPNPMHGFCWLRKREALARWTLSPGRRQNLVRQKSMKA